MALFVSTWAMGLDGLGCLALACTGKTPPVTRCFLANAKALQKP